MWQTVALCLSISSSISVLIAGTGDNSGLWHRDLSSPITKTDKQYHQRYTYRVVPLYGIKRILSFETFKQGFHWAAEDNPSPNNIILLWWCQGDVFSITGARRTPSRWGKDIFLYIPRSPRETRRFMATRVESANQYPLGMSPDCFRTTHFSYVWT